MAQREFFLQYGDSDPQVVTVDGTIIAHLIGGARKMDNLVELLRVINTIQTKTGGTLGTRLILSGTPDSYLSVDAMCFAPDEFNKINNSLVVDRLNPREFLSVIEHCIGYLPAEEVTIVRVSNKPEQVSCIS